MFEWLALPAVLYSSCEKASAIMVQVYAALLHGMWQGQLHFRVVVPGIAL